MNAGEVKKVFMTTPKQTDTAPRLKYERSLSGSEADAVVSTTDATGQRTHSMAAAGISPPDRHRLVYKEGRVTKKAGPWTPLAMPCSLWVRERHYVGFHRGDFLQPEVGELVPTEITL